MKSAQHNITSGFIDDENGARYQLNLLSGSTVVYRLSTGAPAVQAAAAFLLEKADNPAVIADSWIVEGCADDNGVISLDHPLPGAAETMGDRLVLEVDSLFKS